MVAWLMNPALYPGDPVTESFRDFPSVFWNLVALGGRWIEVEVLLFLVFLVTKALFFWGLVRLLASFTPKLPLIAVISLSVALSPALNHNILEPTQTQSSLALVMVFWAAVLLVERRWPAAGVTLGLAAFANALYVAYALLALVPLAWMDWKTHRKNVLLGGALFAGLFVVWASFANGMMPRSYPASFRETLLIAYPNLVSIRNLDLQPLARTLVGAALLTVALHRFRIERCTRFEWLTLGFLIPFSLGAVVGELAPVPQLLRLQFLRSDSFLLALGTLWIQGYGAKLLTHTEDGHSPAAIPVGATALLFPLSDGPGLVLVLLFVGVFLLVEPTRSFDRLIPRITGQSAARLAAIVVVGWGLTAAAWFLVGGSPVRLGALAALGAGSYYTLQRGSHRFAAWRLAAGASALAVAWASVVAVPTGSRLWNPIRQPDATTAAWWDVQKWARASTPIDATFLVPPVPGGFRAFSQRPIWTEFKDQDMIFTYAGYADTWRSRMASLGVSLEVGKEIPPVRMIELYKAKGWEELEALARREHLGYIVQFRDVPYGVTPEYANEWFAAYRVIP